MSSLTDEQLARALQAEEQMAAHSQEHTPFAAAIDGSVQKVLQCEDPLTQALALSLIPLDQITAAAQEAVALNAELGLSGHQAALGEEELIVQGLLAWFKHSFFTWTNAPPCSFCSCATSSMGMGPPTAEEAADLARRVELYRCSTCSTVTRFPRYTNAAKLLETRRGRCGEWAHCFLLCLRAAAIEARHCQDWEDHVWCEFYSAHFGRWVHVDSCEGAFDTPLLYEQGWGKKLSYVVAVGRHGAADVTRRYVLDYSATATRRRRVDEHWLLQNLGAMCAHMRQGLEPGLLHQLQLRDMTEQMQLLAAGQGQGGAAAAGASADHLPGRQSGSEAWRAARGETGANADGPAPTAATAAEPQAAEKGTLYRRASDSRLPPLFCAAGRLVGGACRASGENEGAQQSVERLFDGCAATKWLDFGGGGVTGCSWVEYRLLDAQPAAAVTHYDLVSAEDCPERDPRDWTLECIPCSSSSSSSSSGSSDSSTNSGTGRDGSNSSNSGRDGSGAGSQSGGDSSSRSNADGSSGNIAGTSSSSSGSGKEQWQVVDRRSGEAFPGRNQLRSFTLASPVAARRYRLCISRAADPAAANSIQLSCWNLYAAAPAGTAEAHAFANQQQQQQQGQKGGVVHAGSEAEGGPQQEQNKVEQQQPQPQQQQQSQQEEDTLQQTEPTTETAAASGPQQAAPAQAQQPGGSRGSGALSTALQQLQSAHSNATLPAQSLVLLQRIITNLLQQPDEPKFRQVRASKVQALLAIPAAAALLWGIGFRPLLVTGSVAAGPAAAAAASSAGDWAETVLVMDHNAGNAAAMERAAQALAGLVNGIGAVA